MTGADPAAGDHRSPAVVWTAVHASARGSSHVRSGKVNQDAVAAVALDQGIVVAVADGHGGSAYVRSHVGSQLAVELACELAPRFWAVEPATAEECAATARSYTDAVVDGWRERVLAHAAESPWTTAELDAGGDRAMDPLTAYGSTALIAVGLARHVVLCQLGDGDVVAIAADGAVDSPMPADDRLVANQTTSLCLASAEDDFRTAIVPLAESTPRLVMLATDGYGNSFADATWAEVVGADLIGHVNSSGLGVVQSHLSDWIADSAEVGGDDVTVAVLRVEGVGAPDRAAVTAGDLNPTGPHPVTPGPATPEPATPEPAPRPRRARIGVIIGIVALAAAGVAVGFALASRSPDPATPPSVSTTLVPPVQTSGPPDPGPPEGGGSVPPTSAVQGGGGG